MAQKATYLSGKFLLAMPMMADTRFERSVIYMCTHDESGAMGIVVNNGFDAMSFSELLEQLDIDHGEPATDVSVLSGGPVEPGRGFVLHSADYVQESTHAINESHALTATTDILKAIANGEGPRNYLVALGYAGWSGGQLEQEIQQNSWLIADSDDEILFRTELDLKWARAIAMMGIDVSMLSSEAGHA